jgi:hypothetical protein
MKLRTETLALAVALLAFGVSTRADEKASPASAERFKALKNLAGDWVAVGKDGKPTIKVISSIRVTAAGTAVQETLFPGTDKEMVTLYHLDGKDLVLTHYCMLGNQPRMRAEPGADVNRIVFKCTGVTNLKSKDAHHMNEATLTIEGKDRFKAVWVSCKDGRACHKAIIDLVRKPK